ncbi:MAG: NAD(P)-dependent oxidoreductase [Phycisphaeraceae bacterium]|nr:MAG: NAD(P)-dependent oxidoreductase [Phycisphaeraceae bacterium]
MNVLITGGSGFIGGYFHRELTERGHQIVNLDLVDPTGPIADVPYVKGDVRDPAAVRKALATLDTPIDHVVHLAAAHHDFGIDHDTYYDVNENGARVITEAMDEHHVPELTFYSTVAIYGETPAPVTEDSPKEFFTPYGGSKWAAEQVFQAWTEKGPNGAGKPRRCLTIRPTVTFGPNNFANMYSLIRQINSGKYAQFGPASNFKSLSYVENIVDATLHLWDYPERANYDPYNWIDKPDLTSGDIAVVIMECLGKGSKPLTFPLWLGLAAGLPFDVVIKLTGKNLPISTARIKKLFCQQTKFEADKVLATGYTPKVPLKVGIDRMVQWYLKGGKDEQAVWHIPPAKPVTG